ncbi:aminotransferase class I/II-fold pyridoxal phosphate-dependent enzyme [Streptomyces sp. NPDC003077]|uniref:aminotransferase class I/II-fold pyridoxal phosphate-dependent enzyme n=1 Tax=Streptomyces sp. NPDC003077 TaxID=3154443 RepID=UPI0033A2537B
MNIQGKGATEIAASIRGLVDSGTLRAGDVLPPMRQLADELGVNRNTVAAAYRHLVSSGIARTRGRAGTVVADPFGIAEQEGFTPDSALIDVGSGNPCPRLLPNPYAVAPPADHTPGLYGQPQIAPALAALARTRLFPDQPPATAPTLTNETALTLTNGAVDGVERLLAGSLIGGDAVALEDPCFLASINTVRQAGYRPVPVPVDDQGMTADGLAAALKAGARAVVCTPRAHNPTGASLSPERARSLRELLADHPDVLVIEDDHFSVLSAVRHHSIIPAGHPRWALVRSVSKFLGPDLRLAFIASDPATSARLHTRLGPGLTWVSHLLQHTVHQLLAAPDGETTIAAARAHYQERNAALARALRAQGLAARAADGLNLWVDVGADAGAVSAQLMRRGWLARTGDVFALSPGVGRSHLRLTPSDLDDEQIERLAGAVAGSVAAVLRAGR